jgi:hypothetical protein
MTGMTCPSFCTRFNGESTLLKRSFAKRALIYRRSSHCIERLRPSNLAETLRKIKPRRIVNYGTSRWPRIDAYSLEANSDERLVPRQTPVETQLQENFRLPRAASFAE